MRSMITEMWPTGEKVLAGLSGGAGFYRSSADRASKWILFGSSVGGGLRAHSTAHRLRERAGLSEHDRPHVAAERVLNVPDLLVKPATWSMPDCMIQ